MALFKPWAVYRNRLGEYVVLAQTGDRLQVRYISGEPAGQDAYLSAKVQTDIMQRMRLEGQTVPKGKPDPNAAPAQGWKTPARERHLAKLASEYRAIVETRDPATGKVLLDKSGRPQTQPVPLCLKGHAGCPVGAHYVEISELPAKQLTLRQRGATADPQRAGTYFQQEVPAIDLLASEQKEKWRGKPGAEAVVKVNLEVPVRNLKIVNYTAEQGGLAKRQAERAKEEFKQEDRDIRAEHQARLDALMPTGMAQKLAGGGLTERFPFRRGVGARDAIEQEEFLANRPDYEVLETAVQSAADSQGVMRTWLDPRAARQPVKYLPDTQGVPRPWLLIRLASMNVKLLVDVSQTYDYTSRDQRARMLKQGRQPMDLKQTLRAAASAWKAQRPGGYLEVLDMPPPVIGYGVEATRKGLVGLTRYQTQKQPGLTRNPAGSRTTRKL